MEKTPQMSSIRRVHIVGAGAMGAAYAALFAAAPDFHVAFVARGERHQRLAGKPLMVNGRSYDIPVIRPDQGARRADLVLVALKHHHLKAALEDINALVGDDTVILSVATGWFTPWPWASMRSGRGMRLSTEARAGSSSAGILWSLVILRWHGCGKPSPGRPSPTRCRRISAASCGGSS